jgi:hypothetical protein
LILLLSLSSSLLFSFSSSFSSLYSSFSNSFDESVFSFNFSLRDSSSFIFLLLKSCLLLSFSFISVFGSWYLISTLLLIFCYSSLILLKSFILKYFLHIFTLLFLSFS